MDLGQLNLTDGDTWVYVLALFALIGIVFVAGSLGRRIVGGVWTILARIPFLGCLAPLIVGFFFLPGTAIHELSHALFCLLAGIPIQKITLLPTQQGKERVMGYVDFKDTGSIWRGAAGLAPLLGGGLASYWVLRQGLGVEPPVFADTGAYLSALGSVLQNLLLGPPWLYLLFNFGNFVLPSRIDYYDVPRTLLLGFAFGLLSFAVGASLIPGLSDPEWWVRRLNVLVLAFSALLVIDVVVYVPVRALLALLYQPKAAATPAARSR